MPLYFHGPLNFALVKCNAKLISEVFKKDTPHKYQVGAVLRPIPMLIFLNFVKMERLVVCTCYFDRCRFVVYEVVAYLSVRPEELSWLTSHSYENIASLLSIYMYSQSNNMFLVDIISVYYSIYYYVYYMLPVP